MSTDINSNYLNYNPGASTQVPKGTCLLLRRSGVYPPTSLSLGISLYAASSGELNPKRLNFVFASVQDNYEKIIYSTCFP